MTLAEKLQLTISVITLLGMLFAIYKYFRDPDQKAAEDIALMKQACGYKHQAIDKQVADINENINIIKENHLKHIEEGMRRAETTQERILTILEERYQIKIPNNN